MIFAPRKTYPNGKLRDITKAQAAEFVAAVKARMTCWPITDSETEHHRYTKWTVPTAYGPLTVTVYDKQNLYFDIYCQFRGEGEWPASNDCPRAALAKKDFDLGPSGKWNILQRDAENAMNLLEHQLRASEAEGDTVGDSYS